MRSKNILKLCLGRPNLVDASTISIALYSKDSGRIGQVVISVNVVALYGGVIEVPPELMKKITSLLSPERLTSFLLGSCDCNSIKME
ncbi:hypothetical protein [Escherichia coli]|uniref:hypothetical protein n=1 Tax=Escherichia coli TaxID=562 RepID=UPI0032DA01D1